MTKEALEKANYINEEIDTLQAEIDALGYTRNRRELNLRQIISGKLKKKTYKDLYCIDGIDSIGSIIFIRPEEIDIFINYRLEKIKELQSELEKL